MSKKIKRKLNVLFRDETMKPEKAGCRFKMQIFAGK
jgi:hypothetical protein